jgi:hypothetical protein
VVEIKDSIKNGDRLPVDALVPPEFKKIISSSWNDNPKKRPTFAEILKKLLDPARITLKTQQVVVSALSTKPPIKKRLGASKKLVLVILAFIVVVIIAASVIVYFLVNGNKSSTDGTSAAPLATTRSESSYIDYSSTTTLSIRTFLKTSSAASSIPYSSSASSTSAPVPTVTVTTLIRNNPLLLDIAGMTIDENDNLYSITACFEYPDPHIYKVTQETPPKMSLIADLSNDGQGSSFGDQGICYFNQSLYVPRMGQLKKFI